MRRIAAIVIIAISLVLAKHLPADVPILVLAIFAGVGLLVNDWGRKEWK